MSVICTAIIGRDINVDSISWGNGDFTRRLSVQGDVDNSNSEAVGNLVLIHANDGRKDEDEVNP